MAQKLLPSSKSYIVIRKQVIQKEKLLKESLAIQKRTTTDKRKNAEREKNLNNERKVETSFSPLGKGLRVPKIPRLGLFDSIKRFITNVLMGYIVVRLLKYLPQMMQVFKTMLKVSDFIINMSGKILNGLVTFVDWGYKAYDNARGLVGKIGGEKAISDFDSSVSSLNSTLNQLFIAGMLFTDFGGVGSIGSAAVDGVKSGIDFIKERVAQQAVQRGGQAIAGEAAAAGVSGEAAAAGAGGAGTTAGTVGGVAAGTAAAVIAGAGLLASALGEGAFQLKRFGKGFGGWISEQQAKANQDKNPITRFLKKGFFGWMQNALGPSLWLLNGLGVTLDILGAPFRYGIELIRFGIMKLRNDQKGMQDQAKNLGKFDARVRDGIREHFSVLSPILRMAGMKGFADKLETPGSFGSLYGQKAVSDMGYRGGGSVKIKKFAGGGATGETKDEKKVDIPRTFQGTSKSLSVGSSVGGKNMIGEMFPYPSDGDVMNPYSYMVSAYNDLNDSGSIGPMLGLMIRVLLGDRVDNNEYKNIASSLNNLLLYGLYKEDPESYNRLLSNISSDKLTTILEGSILKILDQRMDAIRNELRVQLGLEPIPGPVKTSDKIDCECPTEGGDGEVVAAEIPPEGKALLDAIAGSEAKGYNSRFPGTTFNNGYKDHPRIDAPIPWRPGLTSNAAGRYQFLSTTWDGLAKKLGLKDFSPANQDRAAWQLAVDAYGYGVSGIINDLRTNPLKVANKLSGTWTSLPGGSEKNGATDGFVGRFFASVKKYQGNPSTAKISPGSPAASVADSCVCDPQTPDTSGLNMGEESVSTSVSGVVNPVPSQNIASNKGGYAADTGLDILTPIGSKVVASVSGILEYAERGHVAQMGQDANPNMPGNQDQHSVRIALDKPFTYKGKTINFFYATHLYELASSIKNKSGMRISAGTPIGLSGVANNVPHVHVGYVADRAQNSFLNYLDVKSMLSSARFGGGPTLSGGERMLHQGEYVIDKDSVDLFGGVKFYDMINRVENDSQRASASRSLIDHLSQYTGRKIDQRAEIIIDDSDDDVLIMPPTYYVNNMGSSGSFGEDVNPEQDMCYARG